MRKINIIAAVLLVLMLIAASAWGVVQYQHTVSHNISPVQDTTAEYVPDEIIVKFRQAAIDTHINIVSLSLKLRLRYC